MVALLKATEDQARLKVIDDAHPMVLDLLKRAQRDEGDKECPLF